MIAQRIDIEFGPDGGGRVVVDGHDLSAAIAPGSMLVEQGRLGRPGSVRLELLAVDIHVSGQAEPDLLLTDDVRAALVHFGWTPPAAP